MSIVMKKIIKSMFAKFCFFEKAAWGDVIFVIRMGNLLKFNTNNWLEFDISMIFFGGGNHERFCVRWALLVHSDLSERRWKASMGHSVASLTLSHQ